MFGLPIPPGAALWIARLLMALMLILVGIGIGQHLVYREWISANEKAQIQAVKIMGKQDAVSERVRIEYRDRVVQLEGATTTIEKEVVKYVEGQPLALACMLDARWVQLHDAAAAGAVPPAAGGADGAPSGITAPQALGTVTGNYATANAIRERLMALQRWVREQYKATNGEELKPP